MRRLVAALVVGSLAWMAPGVVQSDSGAMIFHIQSEHRNIVQVEFYSQSRSRAWPGGGEAYTLKDSEPHEYRLNCDPGEEICYGAWVSGNQYTYWGAGLDGEQGCSNCCYVCGQETNVIVLRE